MGQTARKRLLLIVAVPYAVESVELAPNIFVRVPVVWLATADVHIEDSERAVSIETDVLGLWLAEEKPLRIAAAGDRHPQESTASPTAAALIPDYNKKSSLRDEKKAENHRGVGQIMKERMIAEANYVKRGSVDGMQSPPDP